MNPFIRILLAVILPFLTMVGLYIIKYKFYNGLSDFIIGWFCAVVCCFVSTYKEGEE